VSLAASHAHCARKLGESADLTDRSGNTYTASDDGVLSGVSLAYASPTRRSQVFPDASRSWALVPVSARVEARTLEFPAMPYLMNISFDNSVRLSKRTHYFEYNGVQFKLIQSTSRQWPDVLLTITVDDDDSRQAAYGAAGEFGAAVAWQNHSKVALSHAGGAGWGSRRTLREARRVVYDFPRVPFNGRHIGASLSPIPDVENDFQRRALAVFREADSANNVLLQILLFWQIMEIRGSNAVGWVNKKLRDRPVGLRIDDWALKPVALGRDQQLGEYLQDSCRDAIAHLRRQPGKVPLALDSLRETARLNASAQLLRQLTRYYISDHLALKKRRYLVKLSPRGFPTYLREADLRFTKTFPMTGRRK
jgi:hypothetical protein